jgi:hypothetical protein
LLLHKSRLRNLVSLRIEAVDLQDRRPQSRHDRPEDFRCACASGHADGRAPGGAIGAGPGGDLRAPALVSSRTQREDDAMLDLIIRGGDAVTPQGVAPCDAAISP